MIGFCVNGFYYKEIMDIVHLFKTNLWLSQCKIKSEGFISL